MDTDRGLPFVNNVLAKIGLGLAVLCMGLYLVSQSETALLAQTPVQTQAAPPDAAGEAAPIVELPSKPKTTDRTIAAALYWLAKHQMPNGNWSLTKYTQRCKDKSCTGAGSEESLSAATALGLLPFLESRQSQTNNGPFKKTIDDGVKWLVSHQKTDGDLSADAPSQMYSHGLATLALCKDYKMTQVPSIGKAAQHAINFIEAAQNSKTGGWRYHPGQDGDMSVFGWELMALKSGQMAGLSVNPATFDGAEKWLQSCSAAGDDIGKFSYQPGGRLTPTMSAVGLLARQSLHADSHDPYIIGGMKFLMANQPDSSNRNIYYWYYATEAVHNMYDKDWDIWSRKIRKLLIDTQIHDGCASGSWDPEKPNKDAWGASGGRLMVTSLSCMTLDTYYRKIWLYHLEKEQETPVDAARK